MSEALTTNDDNRRIQVDAEIVHNPHGRCFLPGAGKTEWLQDFPGAPEMVVVPAGSFIMGAPDDEPEHHGADDGDSPQHVVTITKPFAISRHAVTRGQFAVFLDATGHNMAGRCWLLGGESNVPPASASWRDSGFTQDDRHPVICVSWEDAQAYAAWLCERSGEGYRLPTEAEWEYACRAGTETPFWWGASITTAQANYNGHHTYRGGGTKGGYRNSTMPAEAFEANPWGLYQVHGNVSEWCEDVWHDDYRGAPTDGTAWTDGDVHMRVVRGGSWHHAPRDLRAALRQWSHRWDRYNVIGFRLVRQLRNVREC